jgi:hypothetical protein
VKQAAIKYLDIRRSVTGTLIPGNPGPESASPAPAPAAKRS